MKPIRLKINNFFSHRESEVDFTQFNSALLIGNTDGQFDISNGSGKSAVFESIFWCLFNKSRTASIDDIILWGENNCSVEFEFQHLDSVFKIIRTRERVNSTSTVSFFKLVNEAWVDLSGSTSKLTNQEITKQLSVDYKTFENSAYFRQNDISEFAEADPSKKKDILKSIIDISKWDDYEKAAKEKLKVINAECKIIEVKSQELESLLTTHANDSNTKQDLTNRKSELENDILNTSKSLEDVTREYNYIRSNIDTGSWDRLTDELTKATNELESVTKKGRDITYSLQIQQSKVKELEEKISSTNDEINSAELIKNDQDDLAKDERNIAELRLESAGIDQRLSGMKKPNPDACNSCGQSIEKEKYNELLLEFNTAHEEGNSRKIYIANKLKELEKSKARFLKSVNKRKVVEAKTLELSMLKDRLNLSTDTVNKLLDDRSLVVSKAKSLKSTIDTCNSTIESLKNDDFHTLRGKIKELKATKDSLTDELSKVNVKIGVYTERLSNLGNQISEAKLAKEKLATKLDEISMLQKLAKVFGKNGIQTVLLNSVIEDLESTSNVILSTMTNESFQIHLDTQRISSDKESYVDTLDLTVSKDGVRQNFKSMSGGEQFRVSLALRIALSEISSRHSGSSLEFLLLDEINSPLDKHGTETLFVNVIKSLETKYKILVITHNDSIKDQFENVISVSKIGGESNISLIAR